MSRKKVDDLCLQLARPTWTWKGQHAASAAAMLQTMQKRIEALEMALSVYAPDELKRINGTTP